MTTHIHNWGHDIPLCGYQSVSKAEVVVSVEPTTGDLSKATCKECRTRYLISVHREIAERQAHAMQQCLAWNKTDLENALGEKVEERCNLCGWPQHTGPCGPESLPKEG